MLITNGTSSSFPLLVPGSGTVLLRAPGLQVRAYSAAPVAAPQAFHSLASSPTGVAWSVPHPALQESLAENGIEEYATPTVMEATAMPLAAMSGMLASGPLLEPHLQLEIPAPSADEGVLVMVDDGEQPLWFVPTRFGCPSVSAGIEWRAPTRLSSIAVAARPVAPNRFRFLIPARTMTDASSPLALTLGSRLKRAVVRLFKFRFVKELLGNAVDAVIGWIAEKVEKKHKTEGFRAFAEDFPALDAGQVAARVKANQRSLLLVHGIFSSAAAAFGDMYKNQPLREHLREVYQDRIFAWDHFTVSKGALANAKEMLSALPSAMHVDVISHSRGAVVTRAALEHPDLQPLRNTRLASVRKVFFVAGAHRGSALARRHNIDKLLNVLSLSGLAGGGVVLNVVFGVLKVLAHAVTDLPGIFDMDPELSPVLPAINAAGMTHADKYLALRANFDYATKLGQRILDLGADTVFGVSNDLVVPFAGAIGWDDQLDTTEAAHVYGFGSDADPQNTVFHNNFFQQPQVCQLLMEELHTDVPALS